MLDFLSHFCNFITEDYYFFFKYRILNHLKPLEGKEKKAVCPKHQQMTLKKSLAGKKSFMDKMISRNNKKEMEFT